MSSTEKFLFHSILILPTNDNLEESKKDAFLFRKFCGNHL